MHPLLLRCPCAHPTWAYPSQHAPHALPSAGAPLTPHPPHPHPPSLHTRQDCCSAVAKVFTERKNLAASLKDTKSVVGKVELLLGAIIHIFFAFLYMAVFQVNATAFAAQRCPAWHTVQRGPALLSQAGHELYLCASDVQVPGRQLVRCQLAG